MNGYRLGEDARVLVRMARERARVFRHRGIGSEDLFYAVADSRTRVGVVARVTA